MPHRNRKQALCTKLRSACHEIEDALNLASSPARFDPVVMPQKKKDELSVLLDDLGRILRDLEGTQ